MLPLFVLAHFAHHLLGALLTPLLPFIRDEFALDYTQAGWVVSAWYTSYGISQIPAGWLADRVGPRILIVIGISGVALFGLLVGLSSTYVMMVIFLVLLGAVGGGYHPSAAPLLSTSVASQNQGRVLGIHQIGGTASYFLAPLIAVAIANMLGWRGSYIWLSVPTIVFGILFYILLGRRGQVKKVRQEMSKDYEEALPVPGRVRRLVSFIVLSVAGQILLMSVISFVPL
jgi:MFS family permease